VSEQPDSPSFNKNYKVLKDTADWLSQQKKPDIDQLVPKVEMAMQAYKVCKTRLDAVQATLSQYFEGDAMVTSPVAQVANGDGKPRRPTPPSDASDEEDADIPF
jgi:exodeoxyribonuclease VII small subunit